MYGHRERREVEGWLSEIDARIIEVVLQKQVEFNLSGSVAEIGLHHGKLFILLCVNIINNEKAYGIDLFDSQHLNFDLSGSGNKLKVLENLSRFDCDTSKVVLDARPSESVQVSDIRDAVGSVRFFSIDGGHRFSNVINDLELAKGCIADGGVIAIDDYLRAEWPEVSRGFHAWYQENNTFFEIVAIGYNKVYLTHPNWASKYRESLINDKGLRFMVTKFYKLADVPIPVFSVFFVPEEGKTIAFFKLLKIFYPQQYFKYRNLKSRVFKG